MRKKALVTDDSAVMREMLRDLIETLGFDVDVATNGREAVDMATHKQYDIITMDINMPVMDGLTALQKIMKAKPTPILMVSSLTAERANITIRALECGAVDYIQKPGTMCIGSKENNEDILRKVKSISCIPKQRLQIDDILPPIREHKHVPRLVGVGDREIEKVVLIGASTGGPGLIERICSALPKDFPHPVCIIQHMPEAFTGSFASRLDRISTLPVHETSDNMEMLPGNVYLAKGGSHLHFSKKSSGDISLRVAPNENKHVFLPSVDEVYKSALSVFRGQQLMAVLLTGIGSDGADGMLDIKKAGGLTIGESEETATVYGMPKAAYERGAVMKQLPFSEIIDAIAAFG